jgi:xylosylprotein 4-beta-galactosyltransferase
MNKFLRNQSVQHRFIVINQIDNFRFNRAFLLNVGFKEAPTSCTYFALHDVDLLPLNPNLSYAFPQKGPFHVASPEYHPKYDYPTFTGGILLIRRDHFAKVNGMSTRYWGWGLEDDEFRARLVEAKLEVGRTTGLKTSRNNTFRYVLKITFIVMHKIVKDGSNDQNFEIIDQR